MAEHPTLQGMEPTELHNRFQGALVGALVGDALGAPLEGHRGPVSSEQLAHLEHGTDELRYTDDTAMTIALAESLLFRGDLDDDHLAATFATRYRRQRWRGYGAGTADLLERIADGADWRTVAPAQFGGGGSFGNGAAMRVAPVALHAAGDLTRTHELARRSARITHTHALGVDGAALQALAVSSALINPAGRPIDPEHFLDQLEAHTGNPSFLAQMVAVRRHLADDSPETVAGALGTGVAAVEAVPAALWAYLTHPQSYRDAVLAAISLGGDTDTIASMTGALSGATLGATAIPPPWTARTESVATLGYLADQLACRVTGHPPPSSPT